MTQTNNSLDIWSFIQENRFEEAAQKADHEYEQTKNIFHLRNKLYALAHLKKYEQLAALCKQLIKLENGESEIDFVFYGIAYWALGEKNSAIEIWKEAENTKYTDAAGGVGLIVILYFASLKSDNKELREYCLKKLKKLTKSKSSLNWPGALAPYILGEISEETLLSKILPIPILKERQSCQAHFAIAVKGLEKNHTQNYKRSLETSISYGSAAYLEQLYYLAKIELEKLNNI
jgi:hypothetical protein